MVFSVDHFCSRSLKRAASIQRAATKGVGTITQWKTARDFDFKMEKMFMPIPEDEILKNPACTQNEGY